MVAVRYVILSFVTIMCFLGFFPGWISAATIIAANPSYNVVSAAVSSAGSGDTVVIPAGSATWNRPLIINKGLTLKGAGIGNTVITSNITDKFNGIITYNPSNPATNEAFRITGFTFDCNYMSNGIKLYNYTATVINKVRVDHNRIINPGGVDAGRAIYISGMVYGVIDNNTIEIGSGKAIDSYGVDFTSWANLTRNFGDANNIYYEDNIITGDNTFHSGGQGGRYVSRYNTYSGATRHLFPMFDMHGNQPSGPGTMVGEIYGNIIMMGIKGGDLIDHRGGQAMVFGNYVSQTSYETMFLKIREEYDDATYPAANNFLMHVTNSYYWNNRHYNQTLIPTDIQEDSYDNVHPNDLPVLVENREFFNQNPSYNGTTQRGVYCGSSLPANCTTGDGAWITTQSCSNTTNMVGVNPITPISGTLYKCTAPNTWTPYYTPYTYPHPLRSEMIPPKGFKAVSN